MSANFAEDFTYASRNYQRLMEKYRHAFTTVFRHNLVTFIYVKWLSSGEFLAICDDPMIQELFLEMQGFEDDPIFTKHGNVQVGSSFVYGNYDDSNVKHNACRLALAEKFNIDLGFVISEKSPGYCEMVGWEFSIPQKERSIVESQNIVLQDCLDNSHAIKGCYEQFKKEIFPIIEKKDLYRVNLKDIKKDKYYSQKHIVDTGKETIRKALLNIGLIEERDLMLQEVHFTEQEKKCLNYYLEGMSAKEIAKSMFRSPRTVEDYLNSIKTKLKVKKKVKSSKK